MYPAIFSVLFLAISAGSAEAFECKLLEAQVIGTVIQASSIGEECTAVVELDQASPHVFCPLNFEVGQRVSILAQKRGKRCPLSGEALGGLVQKVDNQLRLDE